MSFIADWDVAIQKSGTLPEHAQCFQNVCDDTGCVIMLRAIGPLVTGLLRDGYATKSIFIKAKSCKWGPMAGFVCLDSRFNKSIITRENMNIHTTAVMDSLLLPEFIVVDAGLCTERRVRAKPWGLIPIHITTERIKELISFRIIKPLGASNTSDDFFCEAYPIGWSSEDKPEIFKLVYVAHLKLWKIKYHSLKPQMKVIPNGVRVLMPHDYDDVMSLVDPEYPEEFLCDFRRLPFGATIADYDLFQILPQHKTMAEHKHLDARVVHGFNCGRVTHADFNREMHKNTGNTTLRIECIIRLVNRYAQCKIVHHGDEAGLVGVRSIFFPIICFIPKCILKAFQLPQGAPAFYIDDLNGYKTLLSMLFPYYFHLDFNPGWWNELGISRTLKNAYWEHP